MSGRIIMTKVRLTCVVCTFTKLGIVSAAQASCGGVVIQIWRASIRISQI